MGSKPLRLHHYTNAQGLVGIVTTSTVWATDCRFLNDSSEYTYALASLDRALAAVPRPSQDPTHPLHSSADDETDRDFGTLLGNVRTWLAGDEFIFAVTCFCEDGDLLSQWRGYGPDHGYSIEFDVESLASAAMSVAGVKDGMLAQVAYGESFVRYVEKQAADALRTDNLNHPGMHGFHHVLELASLVAQAKHSDVR